MAAKMETTQQDTETRTRPSYDDVNSGAIFMVGIISAIITVLIIAFVQGLAYHWTRSFTTAQNAKYNLSLVRPQIERQLKELEGSDKTISIEAAMKKVLETYGK